MGNLLEAHRPTPLFGQPPDLEVRVVGEWQRQWLEGGALREQQEEVLVVRQERGGRRAAG